MVTIYVNYSSRSAIVPDGVLQPIHVGKALSKLDLGIPGDDTGDHISAKNPNYCELTGQYWAWKNDKTSEKLGFFHYRRFLDFNPSRPRVFEPTGNIVAERIDEAFFQEYGLADDQITALVGGYDLVLPDKFDVRTVNCKDVYAQYRDSPNHIVEDLHVALEVLTLKYPDYVPYIDKVVKGVAVYPTNIFIADRPLFAAYSQWLFDILFEVETQIDLADRTAQEARVMGFLSERLFNIFIEKWLFDHPQTRVLTLRRVWVKNAAAVDKAPPPPVTDLPVVTLAAASDANYAAQLGAMAASALVNASPDVFIDFLILDGGLGRDNQAYLEGLTALHPHCRICFIDMSTTYLDVEVYSYFTRGTFYRLSLPALLPDRQRVLFLDADMVVLGDVSRLFNHDLKGAAVGAAADLIMRAFCRMKVPSMAEAGGLAAERYLKDWLGMADGPGAYFQAGVILMDLERLRELKIPDRTIRDLTSKRYWFLDQDVLNKNLEGEVTFIDNRWNVVFMDVRHSSSLRAEDFRTFERSLENPLIVHFAGLNKPWENFEHPKAALFWKYLRLTPWYEAKLFELVNGGRHSVLAKVKTHNQTSLIAQGLLPDPTKPVPTSFHLAGLLWKLIPGPLRRTLIPLGNSAKKLILKSQHKAKA